MDTNFYIFNENGLITSSDLDMFCASFLKITHFNFRVFEKKDIDRNSTIFKKFSIKDLEYTIYDHGYVMKVEGEIKKSIFLLLELDKTIDKKKAYYISASQRIQNSESNQFPRGAEQREVAKFLNKLFNNNHYTEALKNL